MENLPVCSISRNTGNSGWYSNFPGHGAAGETVQEVQEVQVNGDTTMVTKVPDETATPPLTLRSSVRHSGFPVSMVTVHHCQQPRVCQSNRDHRVLEDVSDTSPGSLFLLFWPSCAPVPTLIGEATPAFQWMVFSAVCKNAFLIFLLFLKFGVQTCFKLLRSQACVCVFRTAAAGPSV